MYLNHRVTAVLAVVPWLVTVVSPAAADSTPTATLVCQFQGGIVLRAAGGTDQPSKSKESTLSFTIPAEWTRLNAKVEQRWSGKWTNISRGWGGELTAILNGRMLRLLENTFSDNAFYVHVWLDKKTTATAVEALYLFAGPSGLPKEYEASKLRHGTCDVVMPRPGV